VVGSPIGRLLLIGRPDRDGGALAHLSGLYVAGHDRCPALGEGWVEDAAVFADVRRQLEEYFDGRRRQFDLELDPPGTTFQRAVWRALGQVEHGETTTYGDLARRLGRPQAARAVGAANGANPISIIVPCHRVVGADGSLTGYGWGTDRKAWLLAHEATADG
jgi:methylated-DNA-[protein]-cysteine S-methyltransferase